MAGGMSEILILSVVALIFFFFKTTLAIDLYFMWCAFDAKYQTDYRFERSGIPGWMVPFVKRFEQ